MDYTLLRECSEKTSPMEPNLQERREPPIARSDVWELQAPTPAPLQRRTLLSCLLEVRKRLLHQGSRRIVVPCRIVRPRRDIERPEVTVPDDGGESFTSRVPEDGHGPRMVKHQIHSLGELAARVSKKLHVGSFCLVVSRPRVHHGTVIHRIDDNGIHTGRLQLRHFCHIARNLLCRSGGRKCSGKSDQHNRLPFAQLPELDSFWREAFIKRHVWY